MKWREVSVILYGLLIQDGKVIGSKELFSDNPKLKFVGSIPTFTSELV